MWRSPIAFTGQTMAERRAEFSRSFDCYRRAIVCEPRGSDVLVGALLTEPVTEGSLAGVIFFNNIGMLGMCGHGMIGVAATLRYQQNIEMGTYQLDTPVGPVQFTWLEGGQVRLQNVPSYRYAADVALRLAGDRVVHGDIAWGGNWFYICEDHGLQLELSNAPQLRQLCDEIRQQLFRDGLTGEGGLAIDHIELSGPPSDVRRADSKNFVLCPGGAYDRSPCGTGTSAKVACLAARGELAAGQVYRQEGIVGGVFHASYRALDNHRIQPTIEGLAHIIAAGELLLDPQDPFRMGIDT